MDAAAAPAVPDPESGEPDAAASTPAVCANVSVSCRKTCVKKTYNGDGLSRALHSDGDGPWAATSGACSISTSGGLRFIGGVVPGAGDSSMKSGGATCTAVRSLLTRVQTGLACGIGSLSECQHHFLKDSWAVLFCSVHTYIVFGTIDGVMDGSGDNGGRGARADGVSQGRVTSLGTASADTSACGTGGRASG